MASLSQKKKNDEQNIFSLKLKKLLFFAFDFASSNVELACIDLKKNLA